METIDWADMVLFLGLGGGFKHIVFSSLLGEMIQFG